MEMHNMNVPKVVVVILNWKRKEDTIECIKSVLKMDYTNFEVLAVDNGSEDGSAEAFKESFPNIEVLANKENLGYALGFNSGIVKALEMGAEIVLIMNNDTIVDKSMLSESVKVMESDNKIGAVSGKVFHFDEKTKFQSAGRLPNLKKGIISHVGAGEIDKGQYDEQKDYDFLDDVFLLVKKEVFEKVSMYDKNFFLYYEETDLCARIKKAGFRLVYTPKAKLWHKGSLSSGGGTNPTNTYYLARNKIVFMYRNYPNLFRKFFIYNICVTIPKQQGAHISNKRFNCIIPNIKGVVSAINWIVNN